MKQIMLVADADGPAHFHAGDEAILTARLAWLHKTLPQLTPVLLSRAPAYTALKHQCKAVQELELPPDFEENPWFFRLHRYAPHLARMCLLHQSPGHYEAFRALRACAVLHICGGGNLRSAYQRLLWSRSFLAIEAQARHIPVVTTGIQLGPDLTREERRVLSQWLPRCAVVGVRDDGKTSILARKLGVSNERLMVTGDDALDLVACPTTIAIQRNPPRPVIGLTLHQEDRSINRQEFLSSLACSLNPWLQTCAADVVLLPHRYSPKPTRDDMELAGQFNREIGGFGLCLGATETACNEQVLKSMTGGCDFVVTTRFHAAVFALTQGVPVCAIAQNDYTTEKFNGLFRYFTLETKALNINQPDLGAKIQEAWQGMPQTAIQVRAAMAKTLPKYQATWASIKPLIEQLIEKK